MTKRATQARAKGGFKVDICVTMLLSEPHKPEPNVLHMLFKLHHFSEFIIPSTSYFNHGVVLCVSGDLHDSQGDAKGVHRIFW